MTGRITIKNKIKRNVSKNIIYIYIYTYRIKEIYKNI